ncbi:NFACT RNA binding domain-containing protein [Proteiniborus sp. MB09-C3]|uniref:Rqc2 family fibronectin-binding protein n=1 Tax=Proteiniborus sp. MB09-C3 TaxID=3050072 RepID=UPI002553962E|nr:NFACT RNA binding domain-containing protein [Proteiniborus sp. MB09-C3]WIV10794.1 NFACT RNA binding domain-containing protein [Proteiniborus sp. MB09-C3]
MSFDGIVMNALVYELSNLLKNGRIEKIYQPENDEIVLSIRNESKNYKLLISASSSNPRVYITNETKTNPMAPPMFCMLLRKHLQSGKLIDIYQHSMDRVLCIDIQSLDELGVLSTKALIIEIMGKHSNIILIEKDSNKIIDSVKRVPISVSSVRQILPGLEYKNPPSQGKLAPFNLSKEDFISFIDKSEKGMYVYKALYGNIIGLSPLLAREICYRASLDDSMIVGQLQQDSLNNLYFSFKEFYDKINDNIFSPAMVKNKDESEIIAFSAVDILQYGDMPKTQYISINELLEDFYITRDKIDRIKHKSIDLRKSISVKLDRALNKFAKQKEELLEAEGREIFKIYGDLLTANLHRIEKKQTSIVLENYYREDLEKICIHLDPRLSPIQNAQKYYKKYNKLKNAYQLVSEQIIKTQEEIDYLENVLISLENCTELREIEEIREELVNEGYVKKSSSKVKKKEKEVYSSPLHFISSDGYDIFVGKNNKQNDYLTLKLSSKEDIWMHTKNIPGSHIIIKAKDSQISEETIIEAAMLAAYHSKAKLSSNVPVDYTERKNVKKPSGAKPGMVIYDYYNTVYVTPEKELINKLTKLE